MAGDRVVQYVTEKYGLVGVARIGAAFGKLLFGPSGGARRGRVLGHSYGQVDRIAKLAERPIGIRWTTR